MLKQLFALMQTATRYPMKIKVKIIVACCLLHNFIRRWNLENNLFRNALNETMEEDDLVDEED